MTSATREASRCSQGVVRVCVRLPEETEAREREKERRSVSRSGDSGGRDVERRETRGGRERRGRDAWVRGERTQHELPIEGDTDTRTLLPRRHAPSAHSHDPRVQGYKLIESNSGQTAKQDGERDGKRGGEISSEMLRGKPRDVGKSGSMMATTIKTILSLSFLHTRERVSLLRSAGTVWSRDAAVEQSIFAPLDRKTRQSPSLITQPRAYPLPLSPSPSLSLLTFSRLPLPSLPPSLGTRGAEWRIVSFPRDHR